MQIPYEIIRSNRKTIAIQIKADGQVVVRCPMRMHAHDIQRYVVSKTSWIEKHLASIKPQDAIPFRKMEIEALRQQTKILVQERVAYYSAIMGVSCNRITIRTQRTRWGSCSSRGNLNFNCLLALVPPEVLDYVVVHELCHLKQMNHSERFWTEVKRILPNYEASKRWLAENGGTLISRI